MVENQADVEDRYRLAQSRYNCQGNEDHEGEVEKRRWRRTYISSVGETKTSVRVMIWRELELAKVQERLHTNVFVLYMLEEFELTVGTFGEDGFAEGFRDPLDGDKCARELIFCGTEWGRGMRVEEE